MENIDKKIQKIRQDLASGLAVSIFAALMIFYFIPQQVQVLSFGGESPVTAQTFPKFAGWVMLIPGVCLTVNALIQLFKLRSHLGKREKKAESHWKDEVRALILIGLTFLYALIFIKFGYIAATIVVPPIILFHLGSRNWKEYVAVYGVGVLIYILFKFVMNVPLP